jgi:hypothetical protein
MPLTRNALAVLAPVPALLALAAGAAFAAADPPPGDKATFERLCSGCHDLALVTDTRRSRDDWQAVVDRMAGYGVGGTDAELAGVVTYLVDHYGDAP